MKNQIIPFNMVKVIGKKNPSNLPETGESLEFKTWNGLNNWAKNLRNATMIGVDIKIKGKNLGKHNIYALREIIQPAYPIRVNPPVFNGITTRTKRRQNKFAHRTNNEQRKAFAEYNARIHDRKTAGE